MRTNVYTLMIFSMMSVTITACNYWISFASSEPPLDPEVAKRNVRLFKTFEEARKALGRQDFGIAEKTFLQVMTEEEKPSSNTYNFLRMIYDAQGKYREAIEAEKHRFQMADESGKDVMQSDWFTANMYAAQGDDRAALDSLNNAIVERDHHVGSEIEKQRARIPDYEHGVKTGRISPRNTMDPKVLMKNAELWSEIGTAQLDVHWGRFQLGLGEYKEAKRSFQESIDLYLKAYSGTGGESARPRTLLGVACYYAGEEFKAEEILLGTGKANVAALIVEEEDSALNLSTLIRLVEHKGDAGKVLEYCQSTLSAIRGSRDAEKHRTHQADVLNQLGALHLRQGHPEEAVSVLNEAKALREATATETHPNYAETLKGLADAAATRNEFTSGTLLARRSLEVLDVSVLPTHRRIASVLVALASLETLTNHPEQAAAPNQRLETILQKPLAIWKEDFLWTVDFYAGILQKASKSAEAEHLRELHSRQKDRS